MLYSLYPTWFQDLLSALDERQPLLREMSCLINELSDHMDSTTIVFVQSQDSTLNQRIAAIRQTANQHLTRVQKETGQLTSFDESITAIEVFLQEADVAVNVDDTDSDKDMESLRRRFDELGLLLTEFTTSQTKIDMLNDLGNRLSLSEEQKAHLDEVHGRWQTLMRATTAKYRDLQATLLLQQDFVSKCNDWMDLLARMERCLADDIAGNHDDLKKQQVIFEVRK